MDKSDINRDITRLFFEVSKTIQQTMRKNFEKSEVTMPQGMVLHMLSEHGEMKISDLSDKVHLSKSTVSGIVDRLENHGLVERTRNSEDRRTVYVKVTKKFEEQHKGIHRKAEESFEDLLSSATPDDKEKIVQGLNTLKRVLIDRKER
ncbi:MarR family transcriptional regulator [Clostridium zeae]|uniref:MarR family transcriptional regulator n=1 Tax=Clostridium zeae TaxID=2759022 RepID=A0ABQ1E7N4_9CLOT|nr:MarR family transcriptional regulator [Clostridium zeae]GFZ30790.1 MarR family transcriptional regulator [Clostridium zeae]